MIPEPLKHDAAELYGQVHPRHGGRMIPEPLKPRVGEHRHLIHEYVTGVG